MERFYADTDGLPPYPNFDMGDIGAFQLTIADVPTNPTGQRAAALKKCKKRANKHHWSNKRLRKCKKQANLLPV